VNKINPAGTSTQQIKSTKKSSIKEDVNNDRVDLNKSASEQQLKQFQQELKDYQKASDLLNENFAKGDNYKEYLTPMDTMTPRSGASNVNLEEPEDYETMYYGEMPTPEQLEEAFTKAIGSVSPGNPDDSECVVKFKELFENGTAKPGDIILIAQPSKGEFHPLSALVPGEFSHVAVYLGTDERGKKQSVDAWHPAAPMREIDWWPKSYNKWSIIRPVKPDGSELTDDEKNKVIEFAKSAAGCKYNFNWARNKVTLPISQEKTKFYCSQLAWAAYFYEAGINIDQHPGFHAKYAWGVAPQEIHDSENVKIIAEYKKPKDPKEADLQN